MGSGANTREKAETERNQGKNLFINTHTSISSSLFSNGPTHI